MNWLRFVETMCGELKLGVHDPWAAEEAADAPRIDVKLRLNVEGEAELFIANPAHEAQLTGWVTVRGAALAGKFPILEGKFNLFTYGDDFAQRRMIYRIRFRDDTGRMLAIVGEKLVPRLPPLHPWRDTSTLFARLIRYPDGERGEIAAAGLLRVSPLGVLGELVTMRASRPSIILRFLRFFLETLRLVYLPL